MDAINSIDPRELQIWVDDSLLVVNKPAGIPCIPDGYDPNKPHLRALLEPYFGRLWIIHRLDRDTSGVMLMARTAGYHKELNQMFSNRQVKKEYHAIVEGLIQWPEKDVQTPLKADGDRMHRTIIDHHTGKPARTDSCLFALGR